MTVDHANDRLFKQLLGKKLGRVLKELGFPDVPPTVFNTEDILIFQQHMDKLPTSYQTATAHLSHPLHKGNVVAIHTLEDGKTQITIDFVYGEHRCTVQLLHWREHWETTGIPSVFRTQKKRALPLTVAGISAVIVLGGLGLWYAGLFGNGAAAMSTEEAIQIVEEQGYLVMTPKQKNEIVEVAEQNGYERAQQKLAKQEAQAKEQAQDSDQAASDEEKQVDKQSEQEAQELTFTMKEGMTSEDLTRALKEFGLIDNELAFGKKLQDSGIATKVRPGTYTFTQDMNEDEIIQELQ